MATDNGFDILVRCEPHLQRTISLEARRKAIDKGLDVFVGSPFNQIGYFVAGNFTERTVK